MSRTHTQVIYNRTNHLPTPDEIAYRQGKSTVTAAQTTPANVNIVDSLVEAVNTSGNPVPISHSISNPTDGKLTKHDQLYTKQVRNRWTGEVIGTFDRVYEWTKRSITCLNRDTLVVDGVTYELNPDVGSLNGRPSDTSDGQGPVNRSKTIHFPFDVEVYDPNDPGDMLGPAIDYTVTFVTWDGQVISSQLVKPGGSATAPSPPVRPGNTFIGWSEDFINVQRDMIIRPIYSNDTMTITWCDWDGTVMKTEQVKFGQAATPPPEPTKVGHTFSGWDSDYTYIVGDTTIAAIFSPNIMLVTYLDWDDYELEVQEVPYGSEAPEVMEPWRKNYTFIGWDKDLTSVITDMTVHAVYELNHFTVTYHDPLTNMILKTEEVDYDKPGNPPAWPWYVIPEDPGKTEELRSFYDGYDFVGWSEDLRTIQDHLAVEAVFKPKMIKVTLVDNYTGEVFYEYETLYGSRFVEVLPPDHHDEGVEHTGWEALGGKELTVLLGDTTIVAKYDVIWLKITYLTEHGAMKTPPEVYWVDGVWYGTSLNDNLDYPPGMITNDNMLALEDWYYLNSKTGRMEVFDRDTKIYEDIICYPRFRPNTSSPATGS